MFHQNYQYSRSYCKNESFENRKMLNPARKEIYHVPSIMCEFGERRKFSTYYTCKKRKKGMARNHLYSISFSLYLNGFIRLWFRAAVRPIDFAIVTTCLREFVIWGGILHVLFDPVKRLRKNTVKTPIKRPPHFYFLDEMSLNCELSLNYKIPNFDIFS